jgi:hypothetical protein
MRFYLYRIFIYVYVCGVVVSMQATPLGQIPDDILRFIFQFLPAPAHACMSTASTRFLRLVGGWEKQALDNLRSCDPPDTYQDIFSGTYVQNLTKCLKLNPRLLELDTRDIRAIYWVNYHVGLNLLHDTHTVAPPSADAEDDLPDQSQQVAVVQMLDPGDAGDEKHDDGPVTANGDVLCRGTLLESTLAQSFDLLCTLLVRFHSVSGSPENYPPLFTPATAELHPNFHADMLNVTTHSLRFTRNHPHLSRFFDMVKETYRTIIPESK